MKLDRPERSLPVPHAIAVTRRKRMVHGQTEAFRFPEFLGSSIIGVEVGVTCRGEIAEWEWRRA